MKTPYQTIVHEYAVECSDRERTEDPASGPAAYTAAKTRMESDDSLFRDYCDGAEMTPNEIAAALATKPNFAAVAMGKMKSDRKTAAARENGKKGGRPSRAAATARKKIIRSAGSNLPKK